MPPRLLIRGRAEERQKAPSAYTVQRNAQKDADAAAHRAFIEANEAARLQLAKNGEQIRLRQVTIAERDAILRQQAKLLEQEGKFHVQKMKEIDQANELKFLDELGALDSHDFKSLDARLRLARKYPIEHYSQAAHDALTLFDRNLNEATHQEYTKREEAAQKKVAAEEKRVATLTDRHRKEFDKANADLAGATSARRTLMEDPEAKPSAIAKANGEIADAHARATDAGTRLKTVSPDDAPEVDDRLKEIAQTTLRDTLEQHDKAQAELEGVKPGSKDFTAKATKLNTIKKQLPGFALIDPQTGAMKPASSAPIPESEVAAPTKPNEAYPPVGSQITTPPASADATKTAPPPTDSTKPAAKSFFVPGSTPAPVKSTTGASAFTPPAPATAAEPDPWAEVAKKRDAAIAERNKNLDILTGANLTAEAIRHPIDTALGEDKIARASNLATYHGNVANEEQSNLNVVQARSIADNHARLVANLGGQEAYDKALAEHRAKSAPIAAAPVQAPAPASAADAPTEVAPVTEIAPVASQPETTPAPGAPKVIKILKDKDGNWIL